MFSALKKKHSPNPSTSEAAASGFTSSWVNQQLQNWRSPQQPHVRPWSAHAPPIVQSQSPFLRNAYALSTTATPTGELFLFGGFVHRSKSPSNELYMFSTQDFSTALLQTSGDVPSPRYGHRAVLSSTTLLIWGGRTDFSDQNARHQSNDDSFYLLNLVSRKWIRIMVHGPGPGGRCYHTMKLVGSRLFVFGGSSAKRYFNDIWAMDINCLRSNPFWESYEPAAGSKKPLPRDGHVSVTTGDRIIIFGGCGGSHYFNDTWSFNISTRKWTELQCTGSIPPPRSIHAAVLIGDVMYVFGGYDGTHLGDLSALNLSTQRWTSFQDIGPSPCRRRAHAMASDGRRVFVLGGELSPGSQADDAKLIHVLDTKILIFPKRDSNNVKHGERTTQLAQKPSAGHPTQRLPQPRAGAAPDGLPVQKATSEGMGRPSSLHITRERIVSLSGLPPRPASGRPKRVPDEGGDGEGSTEHHANSVTPDSPSGRDIAWLGDGRLIELERQLSEIVVLKAERELQDRRIAQLTDDLAVKSVLLEDAAEEKTRAGLEQRELQAKLDESRLSRNQALEEAQRALQKASRAAEANERSQTARERRETELAEVRAELERKKSELDAVRLRLTDAEDGWARSRAEADSLRAQTAAGLVNVNTDVDRVMHRLMERMRVMEGELETRRRDDKSIEEMECRNEG